MHRLVIALVAFIGLSAAAIVAAYLFVLSAGTDRAARLIPADAVVYANVYLQPSAGQQANLAELIGRFPGFADEAALDDKIDQVVQNLAAGTGIDYRADLRDWLGGQVALAVRPVGGNLDTPQIVIVAEVKDREAADAAVGELVAAAGAVPEAEQYGGVELQVADGGTYAFVDDMIVIGSEMAAVESVVDVSGGADALAARADFQRTMAGMPADHLAAAFVDLAAIAAVAGAEQEFEGVSTAGAVLVAEREGLRLSGSAPFAMDDAQASARAGFALGTEPSSLADWMPADTVAEVVVFGLRQTLEEAEAAAGATSDGAQVASTLDTLRAIAAIGFGIDIDADVLPLLDREVGAALTGFDGTLPSGVLLLRPEDPDAAQEALGRIAERLTTAGAETRDESLGDATATVLIIPDAGEVAYSVSDGIVLVSLGTDDLAAALEAHDSGESLGRSDAYRDAFEVAGVRAGNEGWADVAALVELVGGSASLDADTRDILAQIGTFAFSAPSRDDQIEFHAVLTVDEAAPD